MVTCKTCLMVLVPLLAVGVYYAALTVNVDYVFKTNIRASIEKTFNHLKDPENLRHLIPNIVEVRILDKQSQILDEEDGLFKDVYFVSVVQDLPYKSGFTFNFTRKASTTEKTIETRGDMMGLIDYRINHSLKQLKDDHVEMTEDCHMQMPRALSWLAARDVEKNHLKLNNKIKEVLEKGEKVSGGTQTEN